MQYIFIILVVILGIVVWSNYNDAMLQKRLRIQLKEQFGQVPEEEYTSEKTEDIKAYYRSIQDEHQDIDDITWNDLDMQEIYMQMNNTQSSIGEEYLYALLRKPSFSAEELKERNRLIKFFSENEEARINLQVRLNQIGKINRISVYKYINRLDEQEPQSNLKHYLMIIGLITSIALLFVLPPLGGVLSVIFFINNVFQYYKHKTRIENYLLVFAYIFRLLDGVKEIHQLQIPELQTYSQNLKKDADLFKHFKGGSYFITPKKDSGSIVDMILDYVRILFHIDLILYNSKLSFFKSHKRDLNRIFQNIGLLDSMVAAASFRKMIYYYSEPQLTANRNVSLSVTDLYHPLLDEPVPNSIQEDRSVLITGSNASGKSTFIKTLAINAILSQTIYTSTSKSYRSNYFIIASSMALRDNIFSQESYYIVEIKSLKRILALVNDNKPILCFIDEVLRGTNTLERIAASSRILNDLAGKNTMVFAATHDIELTHILEKSFSNYHFQERISNNEVLFDYRLYQGKAVSKNAIKLLSIMGYPKAITEDAEKAAEDFITKGEWNRI